MLDFVELRSDTTTHPTEEMRQAMKAAPVGDDVFGEDPTVNRLEELGARKMGKEAALFVPSGTMGNIVALLTHCKRGDEVVLESDCHIYYYEVGGMSALGGMIPRLVQGRNGIMEPGDVKAALREGNIHYAMPALICVENTHNRGGGTVYGLDKLAGIREVADSRGIPMHLDGARIFNAAVKLGVDASEIAKYFDSIQFCLSKGLSAPVGSLLAGDAAYIEKARKYRKMLGGGMRQAGIIAAAGIIALEKMVDRLHEDHENARILAEGLSRIPGFSVDLNTVETNIVVFDIEGLGIGSAAFADEMAKEGVKLTTRPPHKMRAVTSRMFGRDDLKLALERFAIVGKRHA